MKIYFYYGDEFGERLARNLINDAQFCIGCADVCDHCREALYPSFADAIWYMEEAPTGLPALIDDPAPYLPKHVRGADLFIAVAIHPDILVELPDYLHEQGVRALIVPAEDPDWISPGLEISLRKACQQAHVELAVPRPFCGIQKGLPDAPTPTIDEFIDTFHVGPPELRLEIENGRIVGGSVITTQPCGAAFYILKQLRGHSIKKDAAGLSLEEVISKAHHSYPCSASMQIDKALDDTPLHTGGYIIRNAVIKAIQDHYERKRTLKTLLARHRRTSTDADARAG